MNKLELYQIAIANSTSDEELSAILESSAFDESITDEEYTTIYETIDNKLRFFM